MSRRRRRNGRSLALVTDFDFGAPPQAVNGAPGLVNAISSGAFDRDLVELHDTIVRRLETLSAIHSASALLDFEVGDRVEVNGTARPLYLHGARGRLAGLIDQQVIVMLDRPIGRFRGGELRCSPLALDRVVR